MTDLTTTIAPKSDQLNSDDLIGRTLTIEVTAVRLLGEPDQPIAINFKGDNGKPYKPCKSMRRVLVHLWGGDGNKYAGRMMTLYRDPSVKFGGMDVGGIRISHMSHISGKQTMALTASKAKRAPYTVEPLKTPEGSATAQKEPERDPNAFDARAWANTLMGDLAGYSDAEVLRKDYAEHSGELSTAAREFMDIKVNARVKELGGAAAGEAIPE